MKAKASAVCVMCDCQYDPDDAYFTLNGVGPFCDECYGALTDADQSLLLDKRLAEAETKIEELERKISFLQSFKFRISAKRYSKDETLF